MVLGNDTPFEACGSIKRAAVVCEAPVGSSLMMATSAPVGSLAVTARGKQEFTERLFFCPWA